MMYCLPSTLKVSVLALSPLSDVDAPFAQWSKEQVCAWLQEQGLGLHVAQAQQWIRSGFTLLQASQHDLEKVGRLSGASRRRFTHSVF